MQAIGSNIFFDTIITIKFIDSKEGDNPIAIRYDRKNQCYVMLFEKNDIAIFYSEESLLEYLKISLRKSLEYYTDYVCITIGNYSYENKKSNFNIRDCAQFLMKPYHNDYYWPFSTLANKEKMCTRQVEAIPVIIEHLKPLIKIITAMVVMEKNTITTPESAIGKFLDF